jgi:hypothetical protein
MSTKSGKSTLFSARLAGVVIENYLMIKLNNAETTPGSYNTTVYGGILTVLETYRFLDKHPYHSAALRMRKANS